MNKIKFIKSSNSPQIAEAIAYKLKVHLQSGPTLLLLSGGSAIMLETDMLSGLGSADQLCVSLTDERFGPPGHQYSNWQQLVAAGLNTSAYRTVPVLDGNDIDVTTNKFNNFLEESKVNFVKRIAILGMGVDGHTSGILPYSPAVDSTQNAVSYRGPDHLRITTTPYLLGQLDELLVYSIGTSKHDQILKLDNEVSIAEQPIQLLKQVAQVTFYNDFKGEEL